MGTISSCVETRDGGAVYGTGAPVRTDYRDQRRPSADDAKNGTNPHGLRDMPVGATRFAIGPARRMPLRCPLPHATSQPPGGSLGVALCRPAPGAGRKGGVPSLVQLARPQVPCRRGAHTRVSGNQPKWERLSGNWPALRCPCRRAAHTHANAVALTARWCLAARRCAVGAHGAWHRRGCRIEVHRPKGLPKGCCAASGCGRGSA